MVAADNYGGSRQPLLHCVLHKVNPVPQESGQIKLLTLSKLGQHLIYWEVGGGGSRVGSPVAQAEPELIL